MGIDLKTIRMEVMRGVLLETKIRIDTRFDENQSQGCLGPTLDCII